MKSLALLAALALPVPALAQEEPPTPASVVAASQPSEWKAIAPDDLLVMELAPDAAGKPREVVIQLLPPPFSQPWVENIRTLARAHWWDRKSVYRVVDNWVAQWGGGDPEMDMDPGPMPARLIDTDGLSYISETQVDLSSGQFDPPVFPLMAPDPYTGLVSDDPRVVFMGGISGFSLGWPIALLPYGEVPTLEDIDDPPTGSSTARIWPVHCYASVGVARDLAPDTGTGSELYAVIGHAPRQLDRNIAVVGRVIEGNEHLSTLPRGTGDAGVYETRAEDTPILSVRLASGMAEPPAFEYLGTDSDSFARYVAVRANRKDSFYEVPAGGVDVCNVGVPIRRAGSE